jgi:hypothetical protein
MIWHFHRSTGALRCTRYVNDKVQPRSWIDTRWRAVDPGQQGKPHSLSVPAGRNAARVASYCVSTAWRDTLACRDGMKYQTAQSTCIKTRMAHTD